MCFKTYLKYLLSDEQSLYRYYFDKKTVGLDDIKRNLMLIARGNNPYIPDHHYRLEQEKSFSKISEFSQIFTIGLADLADSFLEYRNNKIFVRAKMQNEWQLLLPYMPPLLLIAIRIWKEYPLETLSYSEYISRYIKTNIEYTVYPSPFIPHMERMKDENNGLCDLHIHLNGTLETDLTWQDFLSSPIKVYNKLKLAEREEKVKEQYLQLSPFLNPSGFKSLLYIARNLRMAIYKCVIENKQYYKGSFEQFLKELLEQMENDVRHPMGYQFKNEVSPIYLECFLLIKVFDYLMKYPYDNSLSAMLHYYLLILGQANKLLVQQTTCFGFEEFQKYTMNGLREHSEQIYNRRFFQLSGNKLSNIRLLEGRFSPKDSVLENEKLIDSIVSGWNKLVNEQKKQCKPESKLVLIAHFIKKADRKRDKYIRHKKLRQELDVKAEALAMLHKKENSLARFVTGIDAAASEFDAPPEVFAQAYAYLRDKGFEHFTYHAGEDFFHVLSGLRAIYEAIEFLGLRNGDRIGHASACGISINDWFLNIGEYLVIRKGEYLDDLIFSYYVIEQYGSNKLKMLLPQLSKKIEELSNEIYDELYSTSKHIAAWLMRKENPKALLDKQESLNDKDDIVQIFLSYHNSNIAEKYNEVIEVPIFEMFGESELIEMQQLLLKYMHDKEIVIETLPTSNVVIGVHRSYNTYHLYNWMNWGKQGHPIPPIVVGTDDAGIFATNIYNEYCNVFCQLVYGKKMNAYEVIQFLKELDYNSKLYAFV